MDIDKKRIAAVRMLEALGYRYIDGEWLLWLQPVGASHSRQLAEADAMHGMLMRRADALAGCMEGSDEEAELEAIIDAIEAYEAKCWPLGKEPAVPGGKG
jgi:hypothetical protein